MIVGVIQMYSLKVYQFALLNKKNKIELKSRNVLFYVTFYERLNIYKNRTVVNVLTTFILNDLFFYDSIFSFILLI